MKPKLKGVALAIRKLGGQVLFAEALGVTQQAVSLWQRQGYAPTSRALEVEKLTGVHRRTLVNPKLHELTR